MPAEHEPAPKDTDGPELGPLSDEEEAAMAESVVLTLAEKRRVLSVMRQIRARVDYFELLGVPMDVDKRGLKRSYFKMSKEFHPDRYYKREIGPFEPWLTKIFERASHAFEVLSDKSKRAAYEAALRGEPSSQTDPSMQTREQHAESLFQQASHSENLGDYEQAMKLFVAANRVFADHPPYLRRIALCAVKAGQLSVAEEHAKKAAHLRPEDPSYARVLADVYRAAGMFEEAERTLLKALDMKTENDVLAGELEADLQTLRDAMRVGEA